LRSIAPDYDCTYKYTVNYSTGTTDLSVKKQFYLKYNELMLERHNGRLPWSEQWRNTHE